MNFRVSSPIGVCVCSGFVHLNRSILKTKNETNENEELEETETKKKWTNARWIFLICVVFLFFFVNEEDQNVNACEENKSRENE